MTEPIENPREAARAAARAFWTELDDLRRSRRHMSRPRLAKLTGMRANTLHNWLTQRVTLASWEEIEPIVRELGGDPEKWLGSWRAAGGASALALASEDPAGRDSEDRRGGTPPAQLPPDVHGFTGRGEQLSQLNALVAGARSAPTTAIVIAVVSGTAGVGKTALVVRWAHRVREQFPDGQLFLNLRGYDLDQPMTAEVALVKLLQALGVAKQDIPADLDDRTAVYRTVLDRRRMLIVLDNASSVDQVRPLLPGTPTCMLIVTSRDTLTGLVARDGAQPLKLDLLPLDEAVTLLNTLIGVRAEHEPPATAALARQCAQLPLALRLVAEVVRSRPTMSIAELVQEFDDHRRRLDSLDAEGDQRTAVRAVFSWSYRHLPPPAADLFRLLGLHPGPDFGVHAAAALLDSDTITSDGLLMKLVNAHMVEKAGEDRYRMHDLLHAYAAELSSAEDSPECRKARDRIFGYYTDTAVSAVHQIYPHDQQLPTRPATAGQFDTEHQAAAWLDTELANLLTTAQHGAVSHTTRLSRALYRYLDSRLHYAEATALHTRALHAARQAGDRWAEVAVLGNLGMMAYRLGRHDEAFSYHQETLTAARELGDRTSEARALGNLGIAYEKFGEYAVAVEHHQAQLGIAEQIGDRASQARALSNLGVIHATTGQHTLALEYSRRRLDIARETDDTHGQIHALGNMGIACQELECYDEARRHLETAMQLAGQIHYRYGQPYLLTYLGALHRRLGDYASALAMNRRALDMTEHTEDPNGRYEALQGFAETLRAAGRADEAVGAYDAALAIAERLKQRHDLFRTHAGLAEAHDALERHGVAQRHWRQAFELATVLKIPDADRIRARLR